KQLSEIKRATNGYQFPSAVVASSTALPPNVIGREDLKNYIGRVFDIPERRLDAMMSIVDNAQVDKRHMIFPVDYTIEPRSLEKTNNEYMEHAINLGQRAAEECLQRAGMVPQDIDMIITVSCTGFMIPSLDAHLIQSMGFRSNIRRMPFTELGCAAGAMALGRATDYLQSNVDGNVLIISVELPSLTFQRKDISQANLISSILFGDGAAAVIVSGKKTAPGPRILVSETYTFPDSLGAMGFDLKDSGFHILLAKDVPEMIGEKIEGLVDGFLSRHGLTRPDIKGWILHPGGARLLGNVEKALGLSKCQTQPSWDILGRVGNLSSATILFILQEWLEKRPLKKGDIAMAAAFGPGFSAEFLLLQWT
ncbi:MAG TPA: 3-oxoacyl-[acyl-carrier-protein] synthase III C-terminal domain-containing protein, partial [Candidatus Acidoferrum sp.]